MQVGGAGTPEPLDPSRDSESDATPVGDPLLTVGDPSFGGPEPATDTALSDAALDDATPAHVDRPADQRRVWVLGAALVAIVAAVAGFVVIRGDDAPQPPEAEIPLDAWAPYWTLDSSVAAAPARLGSMREISPFWYNATGVDAITIDPNANTELADQFLEIARGSGAQIIPSIVDALPAGEMATILADPSTRTRHVAAIVEFAASSEFDGIDIDYEKFAFADGRGTWGATRPNWVAFIEELGDELHADGRTLTVSIPAVYDDERSTTSGYWVYDHGAIAPSVDRIRIMAYDYSVAEPGPIAPLDFVQRSIDGVLAVVGSPDKLVLGLPAYGRNWPVEVSGTCPADAELEGVVSVNNRTVDDLIERRGATPVFDEVTGEWSFGYELTFGEGADACVQFRRVNYVDAEGVALRMDMARAAQFDGVSLWAFGFDDDAVWDAILPTVATR